MPSWLFPKAASLSSIHGFSGHPAEVSFRNAVQRIKARLAKGKKSLPMTARTYQNEGLKPAVETDGKK
jgi:hypothetical protein